MSTLDIKSQFVYNICLFLVLVFKNNDRNDLNIVFGTFRSVFGNITFLLYIRARSSYISILMLKSLWSMPIAVAIYILIVKCTL